MKVFFSHSVSPDDGPLASRIKAIAAAYETQVLLPTREGRLPAASTLQKTIKQADVVIALITQGAVQSKWVKREFEVAKALSKPIIVLLENSVPEEEKAYFKGDTGLPIVGFDRANPIKPELELQKALASIAKVRKQQAAVLLAISVILLSLLVLGALASQPVETKHAI